MKLFIPKEFTKLYHQAKVSKSWEDILELRYLVRKYRQQANTTKKQYWYLVMYRTFFMLEHLRAPIEAQARAEIRAARASNGTQRIWDIAKFRLALKGCKSLIASTRQEQKYRQDNLPLYGMRESKEDAKQAKFVIKEQKAFICSYKRDIANLYSSFRDRFIQAYKAMTGKKPSRMPKVNEGYQPSFTWSLDKLIMFDNFKLNNCLINAKQEFYLGLNW